MRTKRPRPPLFEPSRKMGASEPARFDLEFYVDDDGKELVRDWLRSLSPPKKRALGAAMQEHLQHLGIGVCKSELGKQLGQGLFEFRLRREDASGKILLRVFCHAHGDRVVLLLGGYDKGEDPSPKRQQQEIAEARQRLVKWKRRQAAGRTP